MQCGEQARIPAGSLPSWTQILSACTVHVSACMIYQATIVLGTVPKPNKSKSYCLLNFIRQMHPATKAWVSDYEVFKILAVADQLRNVWEDS